MYLVGEYGGRQVEKMSESKILKKLLSNFDKMDNYFKKIDNLSKLNPGSKDENLNSL